MRLFNTIFTMLLSVCLSLATAQQNFSVAVQSNFFNPSNLTVTVGDTVTWMNLGGNHNINGTTATYPGNPESFGNGAPSSAAWTYQKVFTLPGVYAYQCDPHVSFGMIGAVTVEAITTDLVLTGVFDGPLPNGTPKGVELYVLNDIADLSEYGLGSANNGGGTDGVEFTFPAISANAGDYLYVTNDALQFVAFFGFAADFEDASTNSSVSINGDDAMELFKNGVVVDVFGEIDVDGSGTAWEYTDGWAYRQNGTGPDGSTFVLSSWSFSGIDVFDNTTENAQATPPFPFGTYNPSGTGVLNANDDFASTNINQSVQVNVLSNDFLPNGVTAFSVTTNPESGSFTIGADNSITYTPNQDFCGVDALEYEVCDNIGCSNGILLIEIICPAFYPVYDIGLVNTENAAGVADSIGTSCELHGIVYGVNLRPSGLQFTIIDGSGDGIGVFSNSGNFNYTVNEGDEIAVRGIIEQFNGLTQVALDTAWLVSQNNSLLSPSLITSLSETTESNLVKMENVTLVDPTQWTGMGSGFNVDVTDGTNTITVRIDNDVELYSMPAPNGVFHVTGIGGQFDSSEPFDEGYQLLPRYMEDIDIVSSVNDPALGAQIRVFPNPASQQLFIRSETELDRVSISNSFGQVVLHNTQPGQVLDIQLQHLPAGIYALTFVKGNQQWSEKLVIE
ncbi:MAG TPA: Ig-like domain-containing protein [Saprospiraceae bacterium]|nr:Ig-like domain-containing protein [Saprospiraceae bacterium]HMQ84980.1 Ig-like domain-containing protein [Saprospiraceae bacterium]